MTSAGSLIGASNLLVFAIDGRRYGMPADEVLELHRAVAISPLPQPQTAHFLEGIVDLHGELAALINMRSRFGHEQKNLSPSEYFIFVRVASNLLALRVDTVLELVEAPVEAMSYMSAPNNIPNQGRSIAGVARLPDGLIFIFDMKNFLDATESQTVAQQVALALGLKEAGGES